MSRRVPSAGIVAVIAVAVGVGAGRAIVQTQDRVDARYKIYATALADIEAGFVEPLDGRCAQPDVCGDEALIYSSIDGMLHTLDPHSSFFTPKEFAQMRERQEGRYYGIGITITRSGDDVIVTSLFEGSPAYNAGMRRGDAIVRVGSEDAKGWNTEDVVARVKGPKGTSVTIYVRRPAVDDLISFTVARDEIKIPTVRAAFMVQPGTGYVRLQDFSETTSTELNEALAKLKAGGMTRLVLDIRDNPGGPLDQAIAVSSTFLKRGQMIVSTRGRIANSDDDYKVTAQGAYPDVPMVVLTSRNSASASEIVTGSLQDHDRGLVVGETTFGKALVQSVFPISNGAGLALTTGRYYTPSGRMIQRPWDASFDDYQTYRLRDQDATHVHDPSALKHTDSGRNVYGGGGIEPDHFIAGPIDGFNPTPQGRAMHDRGDFVGFAEHYAKEGDSRSGAKSGAPHRVSPGWQVTDPMVQEFRDYLDGRHIKVDAQSFATDLTYIKAEIHMEVDVDLFGMEEARRNLSKVDPQVLGGLGYFDEARKLLETGKS